MKATRQAETATIPIRSRPRPKGYHYQYLPGEEGPITAMVRVWEPGSIRRVGDCKLCPECTVAGDVCLVAVPAMIAPEEIPLFSLVDFLAGRGPGTGQAVVPAVVLLLAEGDAG